MTDVSGFRGKRPGDGVHFRIVDSRTRGDNCFNGQPAGWYFYYYTTNWAIDTRTVSGPYRTARKAREAMLTDNRQFDGVQRG